MTARSERAGRVQTVIDHAVAQTGYRSRQQKVNDFGLETATNGNAWAGSFLEVMLRDSGINSEPSLTNTTTALAEYVRQNRIYSKPQRGDLVFFGFSTDGAFSQPHIGLVTDIKHYRKLGAFKTIEGQTASGNSTGPQESDGVYERVRYNTDVLAFARPRYLKLQFETNSEVRLIRPSLVQPGHTTKSTVALQQALGETVGLKGAERGKFDRPTKAAVAAFQRHIGYVGDRANGVPDDITLVRLSLETNARFFRVNGETSV